MSVTPIERRLLKAQREAPAEEAREDDVRAAEDRLEVVEEQLVGQVLHVELDVERRSFLLKKVCADGEVENRARAHASTLEVDLVVEARVESFGGELRQRRARLNVGRDAGVVAPVEDGVDALRVVVADLEL